MMIGILKFICLFATIFLGVVGIAQVMTEKAVYTVLLFVFALSLSGFIYLQFLI